MPHQDLVEESWQTFSLSGRTSLSEQKFSQQVTIGIFANLAQTPLAKDKASCATKAQNFKRPQAKVSCNSCIPKHFQKWVGMMPFTSGPAWAWCLTSGPVWASLLSFLDLGLMPFTGPVWASFAFTSGPVCPWEALKKTPCQPICCLFLCAAFSFERPAPTRGLFPQEAFSHHRKMPQ